VVLVLLAGAGRAQQQIVQDGRLFDVNPALDGGRYNYLRPASPLLGGNPYATGNIGRGLSLRSFSPISSPTAFRADLGSASLSNFMRDSISIGDAYRPGGGLNPTAFYDPVRTAPSVGYLSGFSHFSPATPGQNPSGQSTAGRRWRAGGFAPYGAPPSPLQVYDPSRELSSQHVGRRLDTRLSSGIFGPAPPRLPGPLSSEQFRPDLSYAPQQSAPGPLAVDRPETSVDGSRDPLDMRLWPTPVRDASTPLDLLMQENAARLTAERAWSPTRQAAGPVVGPIEQSRPGGASAGVAALPGATLQPGADVFADMQLALELSRNPQPEWYSEIFATAGAEVTEPPSESPTLSMEQQARAVDAAEQFLTRVFESPLETFVGDSTTAVNEALREAETAMALGRFYDAIRHYERVRVLDPANPLPLIGKGHALLAAGEYISAAVSLINGLERFPEMARFRVDLQALMGGGETVDIRRADLMRQLARNEDPQLRFLLGYLELHSGLIEFGMENLGKAARNAEPGSLIRRYPHMIRHKAWLSPEPPDDTTDESSVSEEGSK
jgi:hypothetical protein